MKVLVTGGAGYIGAHAAKALASAGFQPVVFDDFSTGWRQAVRWGPLEEGTLLDPSAIQRTFARHEVAGVIHFAASSFVGESVSDPGKYYRNNVVGTMNLLDAMRAAGVSRIVFSSTCATYGEPGKTPIDEDCPQQPVNPYGRSKLAIEHMLGDYEKAYGTQYAALRYFNAAGADPDGEIGENHDPEPHLIPRAILAALGEINDFRIFGTDYPTPDGTAIRDYIHVTDLAEAHVQALRHLMATPGSLKLNLGVGRGFSVREIVAAVEEVTGLKVPFATAGRREGDPPALVADPTRAREILGFKPVHADLDVIIGTAFRWMEAENHRRRHANDVAARARKDRA